MDTARDCERLGIVSVGRQVWFLLRTHPILSLFCLILLPSAWGNVGSWALVGVFGPASTPLSAALLRLAYLGWWAIALPPAMVAGFRLARGAPMSWRLSWRSMRQLGSAFVWVTLVESAPLAALAVMGADVNPWQSIAIRGTCSTVSALLSARTLLALPKLVARELEGRPLSLVAAFRTSIHETHGKTLAMFVWVVAPFVIAVGCAVVGAILVQGNALQWIHSMSAVGSSLLIVVQLAAFFALQRRLPGCSIEQVRRCNVT